MYHYSTLCTSRPRALTVLYRIGPLLSAVRQQAELPEEAGRVTAEGMSRLKTLQKLEDYWITINEIENRADAAYRALLAQLFDSDLDVVTMIKIKEVWMRSKARRMPLNR